MSHHITQALSGPTPIRVLECQSQVRMGNLKKALRRFGRQCRGQGRVFVKVVRQTERHWLVLGKSLATWAANAQAHLQSATEISPLKVERLGHQLQTALAYHQRIEAQSRHLTQGQRLGHRGIVSAYDASLAPIIKGKSNCPAQLGRNPGLLSAPTIGFVVALHRPVGNPDDAR